MGSAVTGALPPLDVRPHGARHDTTCRTNENLLKLNAAAATPPYPAEVDAAAGLADAGTPHDPAPETSDDTFLLTITGAISPQLIQDS